MTEAKEIDFRIVDKVNKQVSGLIQEHFNVSRLQQLVLAPRKEADWLNESEKMAIIVGLAMRMDDSQILEIVNNERIARDAKPVERLNISYYKKQFGPIIDEIWVLAAQRIGEVFSHADKIHRIGLLSDMSTALYKTVKPEVDIGMIDEMTIKKANLWLKVMEKLNTEMGSVPMNKVVRPGRERELPDGTEVPGKPAIDRSNIKAYLMDKYSGQLPTTENDIDRKETSKGD